MNTYSVVVFIYNPKSTGDAKGKAQAVARDVRALGLKVLLSPTKHAGHATELAKTAALDHVRPLIVSVSGDGGYNEVINGVMSAMEHSSKVQPVVAVVAAGNANDHKRTMRDDVSLVELIRSNEAKPLDLLRLTATTGHHVTQRYAHSYIGLGLTAEAGQAINDSEKGALRELGVLIQTFRNHVPFSMRRGLVWRRYDSLIFANIHEMAKVLKLSKRRRVRDGQFGVLTIPHRLRWNVIYYLLRSFIGAHPNPQRRSVFAATIRNCPLVQLDGEVIELTNEYHVKIVARKQVIKSLYN